MTGFASASQTDSWICITVLIGLSPLCSTPHKDSVRLIRVLDTVTVYVRVSLYFSVYPLFEAQSLKPTTCREGGVCDCLFH